MGTRGTYGIRIDGVDKLTYNHYDSYPEQLGIAMLGEARKLVQMPKEVALEKARQIKMVDENTTPSEEDIARLSKYHDPSISSGKPTEWYSLLRKMQGNLTEHLRAGVMLESKNFIKDSLFCEWGYIIDLDTDKFEAYQGFQTKPHKGRYVTDEVPNCKYYPCAELLSYDLSKLPPDEEFLSDIEDTAPYEDTTY